MEEIWKDIKGYEGIYKISNFGKILNVNKNKPRFFNKLLKNTSKNEHGYIKLSLTKNGKTLTYRLHRLVAEHFLENKSNYNEINHIDGNKENNRADNLEWITHLENIRHAHSIGLFKAETIKRVTNLLHESRKIKIFRIKENKRFEYESIISASKENNISKNAIRKYLKGINKPRDNSIWGYIK